MIGELARPLGDQSRGSIHIRTSFFLCDSADVLFGIRIKLAMQVLHPVYDQYPQVFVNRDGTLVELTLHPLSLCTPSESLGKPSLSAAPGWAPFFRARCAVEHGCSRVDSLR